MRSYPGCMEGGWKRCPRSPSPGISGRSMAGPASAMPTGAATRAAKTIPPPDRRQIPRTNARNANGAFVITLPIRFRKYLILVFQEPVAVYLPRATLTPPALSRGHRLLPPTRSCCRRSKLPHRARPGHHTRANVSPSPCCYLSPRFRPPRRAGRAVLPSQNR